MTNRNHTATAQTRGNLCCDFPQSKKKKARSGSPATPLYKGGNYIDQNRLHAGRIFAFPSKLPWEFTVEHPIRSIFPLWATYELPMSLLKWFYTEIGSGSPPPHLVYYALRGGMFLLSFVLEDWAIYELVPSPRHRRATVVLVASSYVTWTYQTHTFSNSLETLLVAWGLVLIRRIVENKVREIKLQSTQFALTSVAATLVLLLPRCARLHRRRGRLQPHHLPGFPSISGPTIAAAVQAQVRQSAYTSPRTLTYSHVLTPRSHQTTLTRSIPPLRPLLFLYRSLRRHDLLPADILHHQRHPRSHNNSPQQPHLQHRHFQPSPARPPPPPPTLHCKPPPTPRPSLYSHASLPLQLATGAILDAQCARALRAFCNDAPLPFPTPRTTLPPPSRAPPPQLCPHAPVPPPPRRVGHLQRSNGLPHGRVPPRRRRPDAASDARYRLV